MPAILLVRMQVKDYDQWRRTFESHADLRGRLGCLGTHIFRNARQENEVIVNLQWDSEEKAQKALADPEIQQAMQESGIVGPPDISFLEDAGRTPS